MATSAAPRPRETATFEPYFWEAYNQIARPDRFDWYLINRWLPDLGPEGFAVLKALRNQCYFNPREGTLRDSCQITVDELAEMTGMKRTSLYRVLEQNEALAQFVQKQAEALHVEGRTRRLPPRWRVSMDNPIHPKDREDYELLRAGKEIDRATVEEEKRKSQIEIYEKRKSQLGTSDERKSQNEGRKSQNSERKSQSGILIEGSSLLSEGSTKDSLPPSPEIPPINPPGGSNAGDTETFDPLQATWNVALSFLAEIVNAPTLNAHLKPMRLASVTDTEHDSVVSAEAVLIAPTAFAKTWIEGHNRDAVEAALTEALGRPVSVRITTGGK